ncbi:MAG: SDR family NAD(P)-dependent oxidoreductase [Aliidongia sp.]
MKLTGNIIFITGGGSGIGRGLAEAFHRLGNQVIIAGRRRDRLAATLAANPGMQSVELDIANPDSIAVLARQAIADFPQLNVLVNNAGIMLPDDAGGSIDEAMLKATIETNLMGPIRLTSALIDHLKAQDRATILYVSSALGFVPLP